MAPAGRACAGTGAGTFWLMSCCGIMTTSPVPPREDGRKETVSPCLRARQPTTARPSREPDSVVKSSGSAETARSALASADGLITRPQSSIVTTMPAVTSST